MHDDRETLVGMRQLEIQASSVVQEGRNTDRLGCRQAGIEVGKNTGRYTVLKVCWFSVICY